MQPAAKMKQTRKKPPRERTIEAYLRKQCLEAGAMCLKFTSPQYAGVPDRLIIHNGRIVFVELKRPGVKLKRGGLQEQVHEVMRSHGACVIVINSKEQVDEFISILTQEGERDGSIDSSTAPMDSERL